jgi:uncharacterized membrane protein
MFSHPQIIHFPIALLSFAVLTELISYFWQKDFFRKMTLVLLVAGVIAAFFAVQSGEAAMESLKDISSIKLLLAQHEDAGEKVLKIFGLVLFLKLTLLYLKKEILSLKIMITLLMLAGLFKIYQAGHFGGILVYEKGVGVEQLLEGSTMP